MIAPEQKISGETMILSSGFHVSNSQCVDLRFCSALAVFDYAHMSTDAHRLIGGHKNTRVLLRNLSLSLSLSLSLARSSSLFKRNACHHKGDRASTCTYIHMPTRTLSIIHKTASSLLPVCSINKPNKCSCMTFFFSKLKFASQYSDSCYRMLNFLYGFTQQ